MLPNLSKTLLRVMSVTSLKRTFTKTKHKTRSQNRDKQAGRSCVGTTEIDMPSSAVLEAAERMREVVKMRARNKDAAVVSPPGPVLCMGLDKKDIRALWAEGIGMLLFVYTGVGTAHMQVIEANL